MTDPAKKCRYCGKRKASASRGLCRTCHEDREIRSGFDPVGRGGVWYASPDFHHPAPLPAEPCPPWSEERKRVLQERASRGEQLRHPRDAKG
jgi:hypothetical protein